MQQVIEMLGYVDRAQAFRPVPVAVGGPKTSWFEPAHGLGLGYETPYSPMLMEKLHDALLLILRYKAANLNMIMWMPESGSPGPAVAFRCESGHWIPEKRSVSCPTR